MKTYTIKIDNEYEIEAEDENDALLKLEDRINEANETIEVHFFDSCEVTENA